ncbi:LysR family transcriptional regulator [Hoeflea prorocentri]|uniref:LysR family transcriptional regulator n=1 Tax=Hoeflea prorocentri TaxID=1922333 RepID=A0A9X3ZIN3_9HYPH|nr:LysR family transcriptional regulator [Hoeflea prorocentri]MCY6382021.1 LysR family transcriptional regulator [Hoeflea prorocentri]MDA5399821.1 LysR family transcriptional regulator [Hoeflea prorocentri]
MSYFENIKVFLRVVELGNLSAAGRDLRISPAVASNRVKELEKYLGVRLFNRTTRQLTPTEHGKIFYGGAGRIIRAVEDAEASIASVSGKPKGVIRVTAPLGFGRRFIASGIPAFHEQYPEIEVRLRLSDHNVDILKESIDLAFRLGVIEDSSLRMRGIMDCERVLCASPDYIAKAGMPETIDRLVKDSHNCLLLRFPGSSEFVWTLQTPEGVRKVEVAGVFDSDDGDVLMEWALAGHGIVNKPRFEVQPFINSGQLVTVLPDNPPTAAKLAVIFPHKDFQDPKLRLFIDFMAARCQKMIRAALQ